MKRDFLKNLGLADDVIDKIMAENGADIEAQKGKLDKVTADLEAANKQIEGLNTQVGDATKQIEAFKGMDIDSIKKAAADWQAKAEQAQKDAQAQVAALRFDHALDTALTGAKARNARAVKALLETGALKLQDDGSILGLKEQLEKLQTESAYLFEGQANDPKIVDKANTTTTTPLDSFMAKVYQGAGIKKE